ncbi:MAG: DUF4156 domain-containing protein [Deltaproteobacteria bacterium]|nr:DUF4156 domain-containing protein [Deltaproteobacteria bacterium]
MIQDMKRADCKNLGPVFGKGGGVFGGAWIPDEELMEYASNDMRNKAAAKGATHLVFSSHQMGHSGGRYGGTTSTSTISGVAYKCPSYGQPPTEATEVPEATKPKVIEQGPEGWGPD